MLMWKCQTEEDKSVINIKQDQWSKNFSLLQMKYDDIKPEVSAKPQNEVLSYS